MVVITMLTGEIKEFPGAAWVSRTKSGGIQVHYRGYLRRSTVIHHWQSFVCTDSDISTKDTRLLDWTITFIFIIPLSIWVVVPWTTDFLHAGKSIEGIMQISTVVMCFVIWILGVLALWISRSGKES